MDEDKIRIVIKDNEIISLKELYERKKIARQEMAKLPFEEKIKMLIDLQRLAYSWGGRKDVIVWR